jgi:uncharacterized protein (DUF58 family)
VFVTVGVGIAAVNTGNNLLYLMLGLMISLLLISMVLSELTLRRVYVARRLPERVFAGSTCVIEMTLANRKRFVPSFSLEVEDASKTDPTDRRCYFLKIAPRSQQLAGYRRTPRRRGELALTGFRIATRYPFGLVEKVRIVSAADSLLVYPQLIEVERDALRDVTAGAEASVDRSGPGSEIGGIREYVAGEEARAIHWRRTASLGRVVVRDPQRDAATRLTLMLDNARPSDAGELWDESFERRISRAASLAAAAHRRGATTEVVARGSASPVVAPGVSLDPLWRFLALLEAVPRSEALPYADAVPRRHGIRRHVRIDVGAGAPRAAEPAHALPSPAVVSGRPTAPDDAAPPEEA